MAHNLDGTVELPVYVKTALSLIRTKVALLPRVNTETRIAPTEGGDGKFYLYPPAPIEEPDDFDPTADHTLATDSVEINREGVAVSFNRHKRHRVSWDVFESRKARGGFLDAFKWAFGGWIDGIVRVIERDIALQYVSAGKTAGNAATALSDALVRAAILEHGNGTNITPDREDCSFIVSPNTWWNDLLGEDRYTRQDAAGDMAALPNAGRLSAQYNLFWDYSPLIYGSYGSGGTVLHNLLFHRNAIAVVFNQFQPISDFVGPLGQNVEEWIETDPDSKVTLRMQKYYDVRTKKIVLEIDVAWVCATLMPNWVVDVQSAVV